MLVQLLPLMNRQKDRYVLCIDFGHQQISLCLMLLYGMIMLDHSIDFGDQNNISLFDATVRHDHARLCTNL